MQWCALKNLAHFGQTDQIDHDLDHLDPNLPLLNVVQDLYRTDPTQESRPGSCRLYGSHPATWATTLHHTLVQISDLSGVKIVDNQVGIDHTDRTGRTDRLSGGV